MSKKGKIITLVAMVLVLAGADVLNVVLLADSSGSDGSVQQTAGFFQTSRLDRQNTREFELQQLNDIIAMEGDEYAEARQNAIDQKSKLIDAMETELLLETLLKGQGFADALVTISTASDNISVIVDADELTHEDTVRIYSTITTETSTSPDYVKIFAI